MSTTQPKTPAERARGEAKRALIAHAAEAIRELETTAGIARARLDLVLHKDVSEVTAILGLHEDLVSMWTKVGLTELMGKLLAYEFADRAVNGGQRPPSRADKGG